MKGEINMSNQASMATRNWRNTVMAVVALVVGLTAAAAQAALVPVYRFYHLDAGRHFYTASEPEKTKVLTLYPRFAYEGIAFYAYPTQEAGTVPVYRFYHQLNGSHVYTASESEKATIIANYPVYAYEGIAYYAEPNATNGAVPLYRLYNTKLGTHFFTTSLPEATYAVTTWPWFAYEGPVFYVRSSGGGASGNAPPTVTLAASATTVNVGDFVTLTASAADSDGTVVKVEFFRDAAKFGETTNAPHIYGYTFGNVGTFTITAIATDNGGMAAASNAVIMTVVASGAPPPPPGGNNPPTVSLAASAAGIVPGGTSALTATAADSDGSVSKVEFYDGTTLLATDNTAPYTYNFTATVIGTHALKAIAYDNLNAATTSNIVNVLVSATGNVPPTVSLAAASTAIVAGATSALTATAADSDGSVSKVEFYDGTTLLTSDATAPYTYNFTTTVIGAHALKAIAYDNLNATTTSNTVNVVVSTAVPPSTVPRISLSVSNTLVTPSSTVTLTGTATAVAPGATVATVSFYMDGVKLFDDTVTPYTYVAVIPAGAHTVYATVTDTLGNTNSTLTQTVTGQTAPVVATTDPDIWRLLNQATFGASQAEAAKVVQLGGITKWIDDQFTKPISGYPDTKYNRIQLSTSVDCTTQMPGGGNYPGDSPQAMCSRDHLTLAMVQRDFFTNALSAPDQLRQRAAWALSQIVVTSANEPDLAYAHVMSRYQSIMFEEAFGNFETLLRRVTYNPAMGNYLDMVNNDRPAGARVPNENYAREIMQLFSVGLEELNADGTPLLDALGQPIPTYGQTEIAEFARTFTGYTYSSALNPAGPAAAKQGRYYGAPMVTYPTTATAGHDPLAKSLLNGTVLPAGNTAQQDVDAAVLNVFMHPNTGPYVSKQLIQRLVTGNPTPPYVARISAVFANNGGGVRGDLAAVVRAILLDPEARGPAKTAADFGSLREPVLLVTGMLRALSGVTDGSNLATQTGNLGQNPYFAPTVFNYFPPDATIPGTAILGPEFAIHTTNSAVGRANLVYRLVYQGFNPDTTIIGSAGTRLFLAQFEPLADTPAAMVTQINKVLAGGQFPAALEPTIVTAVNAITVSVPPTAQQRTDRARMAVYLMASSYDFQVQR